MASPFVSLPLIWPKDTSGPGRVLEFTVRDVDVVQNGANTDEAHRQHLTGLDTEQNTNSTFSLTNYPGGSEAQWISATAGGNGGGQAITHIVDMSKGPPTTPLAGWYMVTGMRCKQEKHEILAASIEAYLRGIFHYPRFAPVFHHVGVSRTDPDMVLSVQGWPSREAADEYWNSDEHLSFAPALKELIVIDLGPFKGALGEEK